MTTPRELQKLYNKGINITQFLREEQSLKQNSREIIEIAYDLQAGSYVEAMQRPEVVAHKRDYTLEIANMIRSLCDPTSILEAGVGEATTLSGVIKNLGAKVESFGFDLSWSRIARAKQWLKSEDCSNTTLCTGDLFNIPFADHSIDVVYTSHSIEPNGGHEKELLQELFRVCKKYLILLEPGYELASDESRARMESHGYCKNLKGVAESLGYTVLKHHLFPFTLNPMNPTAVTIIEKKVNLEAPSTVLVCPKFKTPLEEIDHALFSPEGLLVYPIIKGIPCLRIENGILASTFK